MLPFNPDNVTAAFGWTATYYLPLRHHQRYQEPPFFEGSPATFTGLYFNVVNEDLSVLRTVIRTESGSGLDQRY